MASRLHRLIRIVRMLRMKGYPSVQRLCETLQVKERTIFNDLKELKEDLGVNLQFDKTRRGYFLQGDDIDLGLDSLSEETAYLLLVACQLISVHGGKELAGPLEELFAGEIRRCLKNTSADLKDIVKAEAASATNFPPNLLVQLCRACCSSKPVKVHVQQSSDDDTNNNSKILDIVPHYIILSATQWRVAYKNGDGAMMHELDLSSIEALTD